MMDRVELNNRLTKIAYHSSRDKTKQIIIARWRRRVLLTLKEGLLVSFSEVGQIIEKIAQYHGEKEALKFRDEILPYNGLIDEER